jgi:hypothetical protein
MNFLKRWDFWFGLIGVAGVGFAIFTYIDATKIGRVSYIVETQKVFEPSNLTGFTLVTPENSRVQTPVYASEIVIWNSGRLSLSHDDNRVREPIRIVAPKEASIYYFIINKTNVVPLDNYKLDLSPDKSSAVLEWKYFDPGQAISIAVVHSGTENQIVPTVEGRFFETSLRKEIKTSVNTREAIQLVWMGGGLAAISLAVVFLLGFISEMLKSFEHRAPPRLRRLVRTLTDRALWITYVIAGIGFSLFGMYQFYRRVVPPF